MKEMKSVCGTSFEDFNPANLSMMESTRQSRVESPVMGTNSPQGKVVPVGLFHRPRTAADRPTDKVTNIKMAKGLDQSKSHTCDQCTTLNTKLIHSESKVINLCIENAKLKSANHLKPNPCNRR